MSELSSKAMQPILSSSTTRLHSKTIEISFQNTQGELINKSEVSWNENINQREFDIDIQIDTNRLIEIRYKTKFPNHITTIFKNLKCINEFGYIEPIKHFVIDMSYNL